MPARYAPLPTQRSDPDSDSELDAAFDDSDDEDFATHESQPLNPSRHPRHKPPPLPLSVPGTYDFERTDYDIPPPGSPTRAMENDFGNSNGHVPTFEIDTSRSSRHSWFTRTASSVLPMHYVNMLSPRPQYSAAPTGGGSSNDGVFANMMAKPERRSRIQSGEDSIYMAHEDAQKDAPPSYTAAQADSVPPYWETTVHLPSSSSTPTSGEMIIDGLTTGSLFSFLWNMLVSISFQFVGFLLTFLLHTTHSAKLGSRAGLGVTLIQYGFALRNKSDQTGDAPADPWGWGGGQSPNVIPAFETYAEAEEWYRTHANATMILENPGNSTIVDGAIEVIPMSDSTSEWISFLLMTVGWFILLTSLLSFWRVKRWERSILKSSVREPSTPGEEDQAAALSRLESVFGTSLISAGLASGRSFFRSGFSFSRGTPNSAVPDSAPINTGDSDLDLERAQALAHDARLRNDLRSSGLL